MKATALVCDSSANFSLESVHLAEPGANDVVIRTAYSGVSIGTEFALIRNKISWGPFPLVTGYMATGVVESVGSAVSGTSTGDRVFVRANGKMTLANGTALSSVSGTHCSHIISTVGGNHGLGLLTENVSLETASLFVTPAVGYHGVDTSEVKMGETVVVHGAGLIGLGVVAAASLRGCRVVVIDVQDRQLEMARALGADILINANRSDPSATFEALFPEGADAVFECTGVPSLIDHAMALCRPGGKFVWQGNYGAAPISFSFLVPHGKQLRTYFPCDDGLMPCRTTVIKHMASGILPWEKTISHRVGALEASAMFERIHGGDQDIVGVTINWS